MIWSIGVAQLQAHFLFIYCCNFAYGIKDHYFNHIMKNLTNKEILLSANSSLFIIAGPCVVENRDMMFKTADIVKSVCEKYGLKLIFKSSYRKANRTSVKGFSSIGIDEALYILQQVKKEFLLPILTDVHNESEIQFVSEVADIVQIPAFLCRQTDLLIEAGKSGKIVNIKKGQFLAPEDIIHPIKKVESTGNTNIMVTERGVSFGYHNLVVDMKSIPIMKKFGYPVILDVTHSVQLPSGGGGESSGQPEFIFPIARAGAAVGIDGMFVETHPDPSKALSDAASQLKLSLFDRLMLEVSTIDSSVRALQQQ